MGLQKRYEGISSVATGHQLLAAQEEVGMDYMIDGWMIIEWQATQTLHWKHI